MQTVINKLGLFPEWSNFNEANKNLAHSEDSLVKSLDPIKSFEGSNQNMYEFPNLQILTNQTQEISNVMDNANQAISCESSDLKNLESIYSKFQPKKLDKIRFDNSYKKSIQKSDQIQQMIESKQFNAFNLENNDEQVDPESKQGKFDQEFGEYQKIFIQNLANIINELSSTKMRTATKVAEIGSLLYDKASSIEIIHKENIEDINQEMKKLKKDVRNNDKILNNEDKVDACDDDDEFVIVQDKKGIIELSDGEYYEYDDEDEENNTKAQTSQPKEQNIVQSNDENIDQLAKMLYDDETNNVNDICKINDQSEIANNTPNIQENIKIIASDFLVPETEEKTEIKTQDNEISTSIPSPPQQQQQKPKTRRHRRSKKAKH